MRCIVLPLLGWRGRRSSWVFVCGDQLRQNTCNQNSENNINKISCHTYCERRGLCQVLKLHHGSHHQHFPWTAQTGLVQCHTASHMSCSLPGRECSNGIGVPIAVCFLCSVIGKREGKRVGRGAIFPLPHIISISASFVNVIDSFRQWGHVCCLED